MKDYALKNANLEVTEGYMFLEEYNDAKIYYREVCQISTLTTPPPSPECFIFLFTFFINSEILLILYFLPELDLTLNSRHTFARRS